MKLRVDSIGLVTRGMEDWQHAQPVLRGEQPYRETELIPEKPGRLPANERRRSTPLIRLAFQAAEDTLSGCSLAPESLAMVFGTSGGDMHILDRICRTLTTPERAVSPTRFHNSVHNAAAGYWSIATSACGPSTCISAYNESVGAALMEAASLACIENINVLCLVCEQRPDPPMWKKLPIHAPFAAGLVLQSPGDGAGNERSGAILDLTLTDAAETCMTDDALEVLRLGNPAARILPLLQLLARGESGNAVLPAPGRNVVAHVGAADTMVSNSP